MVDVSLKIADIGEYMRRLGEWRGPAVVGGFADGPEAPGGTS